MGPLDVPRKDERRRVEGQRGGQGWGKDRTGTGGRVGVAEGGKGR